MVTFVRVCFSALWVSFLMIFDDFGGSGGTLGPSWVPGSIFSEKRVTHYADNLTQNGGQLELFWSTFLMQFFSSLQAPIIGEFRSKFGGFSESFSRLFCKRSICEI